MKLQAQTMVVAILLGSLVGCTSPPAVRYYTLHVKQPEERATPHAVTVGVEPFEIDPVYSGHRLVYRSSPYEVNFYHYHEWAAAPEDQVTWLFTHYLAESGIFRRVVQLPAVDRVDLRLRGMIREFCEWDEDGKWYGRVRIELELVDGRNDALLWSREFFKAVPAERRSPEAVVRALSEALEQIARETAAELAGAIRR